MEQIYISNLKINKVRHLKNIEIPLSDKQKKHLIITGRNGSGKTSVLDALANYLNILSTSNTVQNAEKRLISNEKMLGRQWIKREQAEQIKGFIREEKKKIEASKGGIEVSFSIPMENFHARFEKGECIMAYYTAYRIFDAESVKHIESVNLKDSYTISEKPRKEFAKYLADLRFKQLNAKEDGDLLTADRIRQWFCKFEALLKRIFGDESLRLVFRQADYGYVFQIMENGKEPFDFNTLSSGYAAVLDIVVDLILRMEKQTKQSFEFTVPGIVLIDEIESHLHMEMQKNIVPFLTTVFPNIQFILSTHSPFILNSLENVAIYDLEKRMLVENGLADIPYSGIVEGYFNSSELSETLRKKFIRYKELVGQEVLSDDDIEELSGLEMYLNEIPDYLALNITTEYRRLKLEFESREDF